MIFKLLLGAALAVPVLYEIVTGSTATPSLLTLGLVLVVTGYHRNLLDPDRRIPWGRIELPRRENMYVRYSIWGLPLAPPRRVRIGRRMRERTEASPARAWLVECLPAALRWFARKVGA